MLKQSVRTIHRIAFTDRPKQVRSLMKLPTWRKEGNIMPAYFPKKTKFSRDTINESIRLYNSIDPEIRKLKPSRFKVELKKWDIHLQPIRHDEPLIKATKKADRVTNVS